MTVRNNIIHWARTLGLLLLVNCSSQQLSGPSIALVPPEQSPFYQPLPIATGPFDEFQPTLSPHSPNIVFVSQQGGNLDLYRLLPNNPAPERLTTHSTDDTEPKLSPSGEFILWVSKANDVKGDIWLMNADGTEARPLTGRKTSDRSPIWHPNESSIFFTTRSVGERFERIEQLDLETGQRRIVVPKGYDPAVSPDGSILCFANLDHNYQPRIYAKALETNQEVALTGGSYAAGMPFTSVSKLSTKAKPQSPTPFTLFFARFVDDENRDGNIDLKDGPSLWSLQVDPANLQAASDKQPSPLTTSEPGQFFAAATQGYLLYSIRRSQDLDLYALPIHGVIPPHVVPGRLMETIQSNPNPKERRLVLRYLISNHPTLAALAHYQLARELLTENNFDGALQELAQVDEKSESPEVKAIAQLQAKRVRLFQLLGPQLDIQSREQKLLVQGLQFEAQQFTKQFKGSNSVLNRARLLRAETLIALGKRHRAISILEKLGRRSSTPLEDKAAALDRLGELYERLARLEDIERVTKPLLSLRSKRESFIVKRAIKRWVSAVANSPAQSPLAGLQDLISRYQNKPQVAAEALASFAQEQENAGHLSIALAQWDKLLERFPHQRAHRATALQHRAALSLELQETSLAMESFEQLIREFPFDARIRNAAQAGIARFALDHAFLEESKGNIAKAYELYNTLVQSNPALVEAHRNFIRLAARLGQVKKHIPYYSNWVRREPQNQIARYCYGLLLTYPPLFDLRQAEREVSLALDISPRFAPAHLSLGWILEQREFQQPNNGHLERAIQSYQTARDLLEGTPNERLLAGAHLNLGNAFLQLGKIDSAFASFLKREMMGIRFQNRDRELLFRLRFARTAISQESYALAIDQGGIALRLAKAGVGKKSGKPYLATILSIMGAAHFQAQLYPEASQFFRKGFELRKQKGDWTHAIPLLRSEALSKVYSGDNKAASQLFSELTNYLKQGLTPQISNGSFFSIGAEVPASPKNITRAPKGFSPEDELDIALSYLSTSELSLGKRQQAAELFKVRLSQLRDLADNQTFEVRLQPELFAALHQYALIEAQLGHFQSAYTLWAELLETEAEFTAGQLSGILNGLLSSNSRQKLPDILRRAIATRIPALLISNDEDSNDDAPAASPELQEAQRLAALYHLLEYETPWASPFDLQGEFSATFQQLEKRVFHLNKAARFAEASGSSPLLHKIRYLQQIETFPPVEELKSWREAFDWYLLGAREPEATRQNLLLHASQLYMNSPWPGFSSEGGQLVERAAEYFLEENKPTDAWQLLERHRLVQWSPNRNRLPAVLSDQWHSLIQTRTIPSAHQALLSKSSQLIKTLEAQPALPTTISQTLTPNTLLLQHFQLSKQKGLWFVFEPEGMQVLVEQGQENTELKKFLTNLEPEKINQLYVDFGNASTTEELFGETLGNSILLSEIISPSYWLTRFDQRPIPTASIQVDDKSKDASTKLRKGTRFHWSFFDVDAMEIDPGSQRPGELRSLFRQGKSAPKAALNIKELLGPTFNSRGVLLTSLPQSLFTRKLISQEFLLRGATRVIFAPTASHESLKSIVSEESRYSSAQAAKKALNSAVYTGTMGYGPILRVVAATNGLLTMAGRAKVAYNQASKAPLQTGRPLWKKAEEEFQSLLNFIDYLQKPASVEILAQASNVFPKATPSRIVVTATRLPKLLPNFSLNYRKKLSQIKVRLGDIAGALVLQNEVVLAYRETKNTLKEGQALMDLGKAHSRVRNLKEAEKAFQDCIAQAKQGKHTALEADCSSRLGSISRDQFDYPKAKSQYEKAIDLYRELQDPNEIYPTRYLGFLFESSLNDYDGALSLFKRAKELAQKNADATLLPRTQLDIARVQRQQGTYESAIATALDALTLIPETELNLRGSTLLELAKGYWYLGDYPQARLNQQKAHQLALKNGKRFLEIQAKSLAGLIALNQGQYEEAKNWISDALYLSKQTRRLPEVAVQLNNLGIVYRANGEWDKAEDAFNRALKIDIHLESLEGQAYDLRNLGINQARQNKNSEALETLRKALTLSQQLGNQYNELQSLYALAEVYEVIGDPQSSGIYRLTVQSARKLWNREILWRALYGVGRGHYKQKNKKKALQFYKEAIAIAEQLGHQRSATDTRFPRARLYGDCINILLQEGDLKGVFEYSERAKARALVDTLIGAPLDPSNPEAKAILVAENRERRVLRSLERLQNPEAIQVQQEKYDAILNRFLESFPQLARTQVIAPIELEKLQKVLPKKTLVVSYTLVDSFQAVLLVSSDMVDVIPLQLDQGFLREQVLDLTFRMNAFAPVDDLLSSLARTLLPSISPYLKSYENLIVIPDGPLAMVPFTALPFKDGHLIDRFNISYETSSSSLYERLQEVAPKAPQTIVALAPARDLPFSQLEVLSIEGAETFLEEEATAEILFNHDADALAIAAHGRLSVQNPLTNGFLFYEMNEEEVGEFVVTVKEIFEMKSAPSLVTLSACHAWDQNANADHNLSTPWLSMANAFAVAGSQSVVASQGRVSDLAASILMKRFYRNLKSLPRAKALKEASLLVREYFKHPAHWASFALVGDPR